MKTRIVKSAKILIFCIVICTLMLIATVAHAFSTNDFNHVVDALQVANAASTPFNPFSGAIAAALSALSALASVIVGAVIHHKGTSNRRKD